MPSQNGQNPNTSMQGGSGRATGNGGMGPELPVQPQTPYTGPRYMGPPPGTPITAGPAPAQGGPPTQNPGPPGWAPPASPPPQQAPPQSPGMPAPGGNPFGMAMGGGAPQRDLAQKPLPSATTQGGAWMQSGRQPFAQPGQTPGFNPGQQQNKAALDSQVAVKKPQTNAWGNYGGGGTQI